MAILLSGDFHGNQMHEIKTLNSKSIKKFCEEQKTDLSEINYHIILGDTGFLFPGYYKQDMYNIEFFNNKSFITLCVLGNHDNYTAINKLPEVDIGIGNPVLKLSEKIFFLPRGKIYNIDNKKCLVLGGGLSLDKDYRTEEIDWWKEEEWSYTEAENVINLIKKEKEFDYVFSHTAPFEAGYELSKFKGYDGSKIDLTSANDNTVKLNSAIYYFIEYKRWYFGHYHVNFDDFEFSCLYKRLKLIK